MSELTVGSDAPNIELLDDNGNNMALSELLGKQVIVYFYPKDDTPGCTKEAISFTEHKAQFDALDTVILGISPDGVAKHQKFKTKHDLDVKLLADEEKEVAESYGVWVEKSMYGKKYWGVERSTFLIDKEGKIAEIWRKVKVPGHVEAVLEAAKKLAA